MRKLQIRFGEAALFLVILLMSIAASFGGGYLAHWVDRRAVLVTLAVFVAVAMIQHLKMALVAVILILAIGANLPHDMAQALGVSQDALIASLGLLVAVSLLNSRFGLLPTESARGRKHLAEIAELRHALMVAVSKGDVPTLNKLLAMNTGVNFTEDGKTPIHLAAEKGYSDVVQVLLEHGANFRAKDAEGKTPLEIALTKKYGRTTDILFNASRPYFAKQEQEELRNVDAEDWRDQLGHKLRTTFNRNLRMTH